MDKTNIKYLKSGLYSLDPARGPVIICKKDKEDHLRASDAVKLVQDGWADYVECLEDTLAPVQPIETTVPSIDAPWDAEDWNPRARDAKETLEKFALENLGIDIDRRKTVAVLIDELKRLM